MKRITLAASLYLLVSAQMASAAIAPWVVQSSSSSLAISGSLSSGGAFLASLTSQAPGGGLTTTYSGTISTSESPLILGLPPTSFIIGSANLIANNSGNWDPMPGGNTGGAPANYGGLIDLGFLGGANLAIRNLTASLSSGSFALVGPSFGPQTFSGNLDFLLTGATGEYRGYGIVGGGLGYGTVVSGLAGQSATIPVAGSVTYSELGVSTLVIPISFNLSAIVAGADTTSISDDIGVYINLAGSIAATTVVPEANSLVLLGLAGTVVGFFGYRRRALEN